MSFKKFIAEAASPEVERIIERLKSIAAGRDEPSEIDPEDIEKIKTDAAYKLKHGWTADEIVKYSRWQEEVDPNIPEDKALARMKAVRDSVKARLGDKFRD